MTAITDTMLGPTSDTNTMTQPVADLQGNGDLASLTNAHFQETVSAGALQFDYQLRPGPCPTTNALRIMELEGLPTQQENKRS